MGNYKHKRSAKPSTKDILNGNGVLGDVLGIYPPNVLKVERGVIWYYHGYEDMLFWESMDKRKYIKLLRKFLVDVETYV